MKLEPGVYKIRDRSIMPRCHYLYIFYQDKRKFYQINASLAQPCDDDGALPFEGFTLISKLSRPIPIKNVKLTLEWVDVQGDSFEIKTQDIQLLRVLFRDYPELAKAFGSKKM